MSETQMIYKNVGELIPYENNPRHNESAVDAVAKSIEQFGFKVPIVIDTDNVIVAGHTRLKAAMKLSLKTVPCIVADDLTEEQIKAFRLADNKVSELATWDFDLLDQELADISGINMSDFGFLDYAIDWATVEEIDEANYEPPEVKKLVCPHCGHVDEAKLFKKAGE